MNDEFSKFFEAAKALITYVDKENVFDRSADMGCGGYDTFQSETLYDLIVNAKKALGDLETTMKESQ
jgi:hypothetical protein